MLDVYWVLITLAVIGIIALLLFPVVIRRTLTKTLASPWTPPSNNPKTFDPEILYVFVAPLRPWGHPNASPFSLKLLTFLKIYQIKFTPVYEFDLKRAPKGKIPWIKWGQVEMGDSELIIELLLEKFQIQPSFHAGYEHSICRMVSEFTVACMGMARNVDLVEKTLQAYTGQEHLSMILRLIARQIKKGTSTKLNARGLAGHYTADEIYGMGIRDLVSLSSILGDDLYFCKNVAPSRVDASVFAILASIAWVPIGRWKMKDALCGDERFKNLRGYMDRIRNEVWGYDEIPWVGFEGND